MAYQLDCQDCGFESRVEEDHQALLDEIDGHQRDSDSYHFVEFEMVEDANCA